MELPYASEVNYWKTGKGSADGWIEKAKREIRAVGGQIMGELYGSTNGLAAYSLRFIVDGNHYNLVWPVLPIKRAHDAEAAKRQAATMLYHDVKARCMSAKVLGVRTAFFPFLQLPSGETAAQANMPDLMVALPLLLEGKR